MGTLASLFKNASGSKVEEKFNDAPINAESSVQEVLDYIMVRLCELMDTKEAAFKGGYMLSQMLPKDESRGTTDIDFSIYRKEYYEIVKSTLVQIVNELIATGVCTSYELKDNVEPTMSGGINFIKEDGSKHLGIDIGLHDLSCGIKNVEVQGKNVLSFTPTRMLSDKISAMFTRKRFRRSKDLYDFWVITNHYDVDLRELVEYIDMRGELDFGLSPVREEIFDGYKHAYDLLNTNVNMDAGKVMMPKPAFEIVISRLSLFIHNFGKNVVWNHEKREMEDAVE